MASQVGVKQWLDSILLSQYQNNFTEYGYDTLPKCGTMTESDLVRIGVTLPGHIKRIISNLEVLKSMGSLAPLQRTASRDSTYMTSVSLYRSGDHESMNHDDEEDKEVYDTPPPTRMPVNIVAPVRRDQEYMNFREMEDIPPPMLPTKKKVYSEDIDEKLGIVQRNSIYENAELRALVRPTSTKLPSTEFEKKAPIPIPRQKSELKVAEQRPVAAPRKSIVTDSNTAKAVDNFNQSLAANFEDKQNIGFGSRLGGLGQNNLTIEKCLLEFDLECGVSKAQNPNNLARMDATSNNVHGVDQNENCVNMESDKICDKSPTKSADEDEYESPNSKGVYENQIAFKNQNSATSNISEDDLYVNTQFNSQSLSNSISSDAPENLFDSDLFRGSGISRPVSSSIIYEFDPIKLEKSKNPANLGEAGDISKKTSSSISPKKPINVTIIKPFVANRSSPPANVKSSISLFPSDDILYEDIGDRDQGMDPSGLDFVDRSSFADNDNLRRCSSQESFSLPPPEFTPPPFPISNLLVDLDPMPCPVVPARPEPNDVTPAIPTRRGISQQSLNPSSVDSSSIASSSMMMSEKFDDVSVEYAECKGSTTEQSSLNQKKKFENGAYAEMGAENIYTAYDERKAGHLESSPPVNQRSNTPGTSSHKSSSSSGSSNFPICHKGFLLKVDGTQKLADLQRKWFVLDNDTFTCFESDKVTKVDEIDRRQLLSIGFVRDGRQEFCFELITKTAGLTWLLAAEKAEDRTTWICMLARSMACIPSEDLNQILELDRGGNAYVKCGTTSDEWTFTWVHLQHKTLYVYSKADEFEVFDLRKSRGFRALSLSERYQHAEESSPIVIDFPNARVCLQGHLRYDTTTWHTSLNQTLSSVDNSLSNQFLTVDNIPVIVDKCILFITAYGMEAEGIYRLSGQNSKVSKLLDLFMFDSRNVAISQEEYRIHDVANCVKRFFRQLDDSLFTKKLYNCWIEATSLSDTQRKLQTYKDLLAVLPVINYSTLKLLIAHLVKISEMESINKMNTINLASIFGPILMTVDKGDKQPLDGFGLTNQEIIVFKDLLDNHTWLFDVKPEEVEHDQKIAAAMKKIDILNQAKNSSRPDVNIHDDGMLVGIYINSRESQDNVTLKVTKTTTALELANKVAEKAKLSITSRWSLFECICNGELERPIHFSEHILDVMLKWSKWPVEFCLNNCICLRQNTLYDELELVFEPQMSMFSELRYASKKTFKKHAFEFTQYSLSYRKDLRLSHYANVWKIEDITIYNGIPQQRNPPSKWGFTFCSTTDRLTSPYFGHSVCCQSEEELYRWLSVMLHAKHPEGLFPNNGTTKSSAVHRRSAAPGSIPLPDPAEALASGSSSSSQSSQPVPLSTQPSQTPSSSAQSSISSIINKFQKITRRS